MKLEEDARRGYALAMSFPESDAQFLLLHNPRCSKSRAARVLLEAREVAFSERRYLEARLSIKELVELERRLGRPATEWVRRGEAAFAASGLGEDASSGEILEAMAVAPILIERPILLRGSRAVIGRPPEQVLTLL